MSRPVTLFTGQWADLPFAEMARKAKEFGYDGMELACWGDHFEVDKALADDSYCQQKRELLESHDLQCLAISAHLVGQAVLRHHRRAAQGDSARLRVGRRRPGGRERAGGRRTEEHGPRGAEVRRERGQRFHRFEHLASALFVPAGAANR